MTTERRSFMASMPSRSRSPGEISFRQSLHVLLLGRDYYLRFNGAVRKYGLSNRRSTVAGLLARSPPGSKVYAMADDETPLVRTGGQEPIHDAITQINKLLKYWNNHLYFEFIINATAEDIIAFSHLIQVLFGCAT